jgi:hypothetical protein
MKKMLFALLCVACTGTAWAQSPLPNQPVMQPTLSVIAIQPGTPIQQVSGGRILSGPACGAPAYCAPACAPVCTPTKTICVPEPSIKVITKVNYSSLCEKVCVPKCRSFFGSRCDSGCQASCESNVYQKKYLVKTLCVTECPTTKCVPVEVPACETRGGILHYRQQAAGIGAPVVVESIPVAPTKK